MPVLGKIDAHSGVSGSFSEARTVRNRRISRDNTTAGHQSSVLTNGWTGDEQQRHLLEGMLSLAEIKEWADTVEAQSTAKLIKFSHNTDKPAHRAVTEILFGHGVNEYRVWIFPEFNIIYVDAFHKGMQSDTKLFRGPLTRRSLESISMLLKGSQL